MSQKLVPYERYKDSGVEWLGAIPDEWGKKRLRFLFEIKKRIAGSEDYDVLSITQRGIKVKDLENNDGQISMDYTKYQFVEIGDFAMNHMDLLTGWIDISQHFGVTSPDYRVFSMQSALEAYPRYFLYLFQMGYKEKIFYSYGQGSSQLGRWRLPTEQFQDITFPFPSPTEQKIISAYLDKQTSRFDALVKEQEELILLLKEKRQAIISHAVTKGLDPNAKMKPSGVEWLGDIPEGWKCSKLGYIAEFTSGGTPSKERDDYWIGEIPWVSPKDMKARLLFDSEDHISRLAVEESGLKLVPANSLLIVVRGMILVHTFPVVRVGIEVTINQDVKAMQLADFMVTNFVHYYLEGVSKSVLDFFVDEAAHGTLAIRMERFSGLPVIVPPRNEQSRIADFLEIETQKIDELISEAESTIALMQEHRSALISAVVTGKVKVPA